MEGHEGVADDERDFKERGEQKIGTFRLRFAAGLVNALLPETSDGRKCY